MNILMKIKGASARLQPGFKVSRNETDTVRVCSQQLHFQAFFSGFDSPDRDTFAEVLEAQQGNVSTDMSCGERRWKYR